MNNFNTFLGVEQQTWQDQASWIQVSNAIF